MDTPTTLEPIVNVDASSASGKSWDMSAGGKSTLELYMVNTKPTLLSFVSSIWNSSGEREMDTMLLSFVSSIWNSSGEREMDTMLLLSILPADITLPLREPEMKEK